MGKIFLHIILAITAAFAALSALFIYYSADKYSQYERAIIERQAKDYTHFLQENINGTITKHLTQKLNSKTVRLKNDDLKELNPFQYKKFSGYYTPLNYEYEGNRLSQVHIKFYVLNQNKKDTFNLILVSLSEDLKKFKNLLPPEVNIRFSSLSDNQIDKTSAYATPFELKILGYDKDIAHITYLRERPYYTYILSEIAQNDLLVIMIVTLLTTFSSLVFYQKFIQPLQQLTEMSTHIQKQQHLDVDSNNDFESISTTLLELTNSLIDKQKQLDFQKVALDSSAIVVETDPRGKIIYVNDKFVEISRFSREELIGQSHRIINSGHHEKEFFKKMWETIKKGRIWRGEVKNKTKDGNEYWVDTTIVPFKNHEGKLIKYVAIRFDITQLKKTEDLLHKQTTIASDALNAKDDFIANMSHEIRNPLNSILGLADILEETNLNNIQEGYLKSLKFSSDSLLHLVNEILDLSKIQSGKLELESISFDFLNLCENVLEMIALKNQNDSVNFYIDFAPNVPMSLIGDPHRLKQILINLLGNAIKFTKHGSITLTVRHINTNLIDHITNLAISVSDTGVGIDKKNIEKIFDSYSQEHSGISREFGGTGLGLNIVQKIIQEMNGDIKVNSIKDKGTIFTCHLSFEVPMETQSGFSHSMSQLLMEKSIFILDNDTKRSKILKTMLEISHAKLVEASSDTRSVESNLDMLESYDYLFLSTNLGENNRALRIFNYIKSNPTLQEKSIYLLSDSGNKNEAFLKDKINHNQIPAPLIPTKVESILNKIYDQNHLKTILVIDDEVEILEQYRESLADQNYNVLTAENVSDALNLFNKTKVDTIISDLKLPDRSGLDFFKEVRQKDPHVPLIMISGFLTDKVKKAAEKFNTVDCVSKPFNNEKVLNLISKTINDDKIASQPKVVLETNSKSLKILIVDDSEDNRNLIRIYFKDSDHELSFATNGQEAYEIYTVNDFDIVFMDIQMPVLSGIEAMKKIRKWERKNHTERTIFYALTANVLESQRQEALQSGYDGFLSKPIKKKDIFEIINIEDWVNTA